MPGMRYEETEGVIAPGSNVLLYSDGLIEAHDPAREMFGFPRLREAMPIDDAGSELLDRLLETLQRFTGADWEQEDDITLVTLRRSAGVADDGHAAVGGPTASSPRSASRATTGNEREAMDRVAAAVADLGLPADRLERLKTAVSEAAMNAIEYGSQGQRRRPVRRRGRRDDRRGDRRPRHRPRPVRRRPDRRRGPRHRAQARRRAEAARLGPLPDRAHGRRDGRDDRRRACDPDGDPAHGPRGDAAMDDRQLRRRGRGRPRRGPGPDARRPRQPRRRARWHDAYARSPSLGSHPGHARLRRRRLHQQHRHRPRRPPARGRPARRPRRSGRSA